MRVVSIRDGARGVVGGAYQLGLPRGLGREPRWGARVYHQMPLRLCLKFTVQAYMRTIGLVLFVVAKCRRGTSEDAIRRRRWPWRPWCSGALLGGCAVEPERYPVNETVCVVGMFKRYSGWSYNSEAELNRIRILQVSCRSKSFSSAGTPAQPSRGGSRPWVMVGCGGSRACREFCLPCSTLRCAVMQSPFGGLGLI